MAKFLFLILIISTLHTGALGQQIDIQGHRGCRGIMPENTIEGFLKAVQLGVSTLELDVVITKDNKVVVSHEPFISSTICYAPGKKYIREEDEKFFNIYNIPYDSLVLYDCGTRYHPDFPGQKKFSTGKPLLSEVFKAVEGYVRDYRLSYVNYNIELKSTEAWDGVFHPDVPEFSKLVYNVIDAYIPWSRVTIQSFDTRILEYFHQYYPRVRLAYLVEEGEIDENLEKLSFKPDIYSPYYGLLKKKKVRQLQKKGIEVIPWTVNEPDDIKKILSYEVEGIISDYPDRVIKIQEQ